MVFHMGVMIQTLLRFPGASDITLEIYIFMKAEKSRTETKIYQMNRSCIKNIKGNIDKKKNQKSNIVTVQCRIL